MQPSNSLGYKAKLKRVDLIHTEVFVHKVKKIDKAFRNNSFSKQDALKHLLSCVNKLLSTFLCRSGFIRELGLFSFDFASFIPSVAYLKTKTKHKLKGFYASTYIKIIVNLLRCFR